VSNSGKQSDPALWLDDIPFNSTAVLDVLRLNKQLPMLVKELVLNHTLKDVALERGQADEMIAQFRAEQKLDEDEAFLDFLNRNHLDESLLKSSLSRPHKIVRFREERWGPRANSLYLKHKDRYDQITYRRLQSSNADVMQEVFFRLKDREDSWESLAKHFPGAKADSDARFGPQPVSKVEAPLVDALRRAGPGTVIRPINLKGQVVVAELEQLEASRFDENLRTLILREEFDQWLEEECSKMLSKLQVPA